jgi:hypothetical protein
MRSGLLIAFVLLGCGGKPSPPDMKKYEAMSAEERCKATEPRASMCADELVVMDLRDLAGDLGSEMTNAVEKDLEGKGQVDSAQAKEVHRSICRGDRTTAYMDAVVECWAVEHCKDFANCVSAARAKAAKPPR